MNKLQRKKSKDLDIIQIILKPFLGLGFVVMLCFGLVYYLGYIIVCAISKNQNKYGNLKNFIKVLQTIVFGNTVRNQNNINRQRAKVKKSRKQSAEYFDRPKGRYYVSNREKSFKAKLEESQKEEKKNYFFKRFFAYAKIYFLKEEIRKETAKEIDQKYPPRQRKERDYKSPINAKPIYTASNYPANSIKTAALNNEVDDNKQRGKMPIIRKRIMISSLAVIGACFVIFVGALAYAQELPANLNFISPKPTADIFQTTVPMPENQVCEVLPDDEQIYLEYTDDDMENGETDLNDKADAAQSNENGSVSGNITTQPKIYKQGDEDPEIANIQKRLMELHYMKSTEPTNYYGKNTTYAMEYFQRQHGLQVDGTTGAETLAILYSDEAEEYKVDEGTEGADVKDIQNRLYKLKYLSSSSYITGYYGSKTKSAVKTFQSKNGLSSDGIIGYHTYSKLFSSSAKENDTNPPDDDDDDDDSPPDDDDDYDGNGSAADIVAVARSLKDKGYKYVWGGKRPSDGGFDCSGFVYYVINQAGIKMGYKDSSAWAKTSDFKTIENMSDLRAGDICVFKGHVGIYLGNNMMIHSTSWSGGSGITITSIDTDYRRENWIWGKRVAN